ncbi:hypothetical protein RRG08_049171 [Elysia crispata]|uniref:Uncharacterized protein n=1 Tax=Elysia crispata TaxID=231223 RepID=A0AAE1AR32_9GAST|nr:hypothetical protein RRG08_049171 [Elysia crispata]
MRFLVPGEGRLPRAGQENQIMMDETAENESHTPRCLWLISRSCLKDATFVTFEDERSRLEIDADSEGGVE